MRVLCSRRHIWNELVGVRQEESPKQMLQNLEHAEEQQVNQPRRGRRHKAGSGNHPLGPFDLEIIIDQLILHGGHLRVFEHLLSLRPLPLECHTPSATGEVVQAYGRGPVSKRRGHFREAGGLELGRVAEKQVRQVQQQLLPTLSGG
eukprot:5395404-Alexandrium_andersonii.AAC.2